MCYYSIALLTLSYLSDMYKGIQKRKSQGFHSTEKTSEGLSTLKSNNSSIRRCRVAANPSHPSTSSPHIDPSAGETAELLCQELSDDEGTYQAVDIVFDAPLCKGSPD